MKRIEEGDAVRFVSPLVRFEAVTGLARSRSGAASFKTRNRIPRDEFEYLSKFSIKSSFSFLCNLIILIVNLNSSASESAKEL